MRENRIIVLPVNILTGMACWLLGPHDSLVCVLIIRHSIYDRISVFVFIVECETVLHIGQVLMLVKYYVL